MAPGADEVDDAAPVEHDVDGDGQDGDGQDDPLRARRDALEEAAQHAAKIAAKMREVKAELQKMKDSLKGRGSGNPGKAYSQKKKMLLGQLNDLEEGRLPAANAGLRRPRTRTSTRLWNVVSWINTRVLMTGEARVGRAVARLARPGACRRLRRLRRLIFSFFFLSFFLPPPSHDTEKLPRSRQCCPGEI